MVFIHAYTDDAEAGMVEAIGTIIASTAKAVQLDGEGRVEWLPKSKIVVRNAGRGQSAVLMPQWLGRLKGYI